MSVWDIQTEFAAGVFSDQVTGGRCSATVQCEASGLVAQTANGQRFFLHYDQLQLLKKVRLSVNSNMAYLFLKKGKGKHLLYVIDF